jgi:putative copper resistance protein D
VVVPWLRGGGAGAVDAGNFLRQTGTRFRSVGWICFGLILVTGTFNLWIRGVRPANLVDGAFWTSAFGSAVGLKLLAFALVLTLSAIHDFQIGPRATEAIRRDPRSEETAELRRRATLLGRINGVLALVLVALGVVLVRGWPW